MRKSLVGVMALAAVTGLLLLGYLAKSSDHDDSPLRAMEARQDANITDMYAFVRGSDLVMILSTNPRIPPTVSEYTFPTDVEFAFNIDADAPLGPDGTLLDKSAVQEDVVIRIRFRPDGTAEIKGPFSMFYAGLRDDPFIRGPRMGRNTACIVVQTPLKAILKGQSTLLIWATAKVDGLGGPFQDFFGNPFVSQFNRGLNVVHPKDHFREFGFGPDVMVLDTSRPSGFPNGRLLTDDVVDMVNQMVTTDPSRLPINARDFTERVMKTDWPFPMVNDLPFSAEFPYLAPPHRSPSS
jgi:hypothetical protein